MIWPANTPSFTKQNLGWLYPLIFRILYWPLHHCRLVRRGTNDRKCIDTWVVCFFSGGILALIVSRLQIPQWLGWTIIGILGLRVLSILNVLLFSIIRYQNPKAKADWSSRGRTVILGIINLLEIFIVFAAVHSLLPPGSLCPDIHGDPFNGLYFSVVAGITLGFGDIKPISAWAKLFCIIQPVIILVTVLNMITFARGSHMEKTEEDSIRHRYLK